MVLRPAPLGLIALTLVVAAPTLAADRRIAVHNFTGEAAGAVDPVVLGDRMHSMASKRLAEVVGSRTAEIERCVDLARGWAPDDKGVAFDAIDHVRAVPACEAAVKAEPENLALQTHLARALLKAGRDVDAVRWFRKAAEQGYAGAQQGLGAMYANGEGVTQSDAEAVKWFRKAAEQGYALAQYSLGIMYASGRGVTQSDVDAVRWFRKAAEQGNALAQASLGLMYKNGQGVTQSHAEAVKWYRKAAEQGEPGAQNSLGIMYVTGRGVAQSHAEAVKWYRKAAEQGKPDAQFKLGFMYKNGLGVTQSDAEAVKWYRKAAEQGDWSAQTALKRRGMSW